MNVKTDKYSVGVVVARFQLHELHDAHKELIDSVLAKHPKVFIFLGLSPLRGTINDPLDFQPRKQMLMETYPPGEYPNLHVGYIKDMRDDVAWSKQLDNLIRDQLSPIDTVVLYGSRDSFLARYSGKYPTIELESTRNVSGTEIREKLAQAPQSHPLFRAGMVHSAFQRFPTVYSTVDVLVFDPKERRILLGRKAGETAYRFIGGFSDPSDESFEHAALRELGEEANLTVGLQGLRYVGSKKVDDWRYRDNPSEKIITHLYVGIYSMGCATAGDDIAEVRWFKHDMFDPARDLVSEHRDLWPLIKTYIDINFPAAKVA